MIINITETEKVEISDELLKEMEILINEDSVLCMNQLRVMMKANIYRIYFDVKEYAASKGFSIFTGKDLLTNLYQGCLKDKNGTIITESYYDSELEAVFDMAERIRSGSINA